MVMGCGYRPIPETEPRVLSQLGENEERGPTSHGANSASERLEARLHGGQKCAERLSQLGEKTVRQNTRCDATKTIIVSKECHGPTRFSVSRFLEKAVRVRAATQIPTYGRPGPTEIVAVRATPPPPPTNALIDT